MKQVADNKQTNTGEQVTLSVNWSAVDTPLSTISSSTLTKGSTKY